MKISSLLVTMVLQLNKSFVVLKVEALINLTGDDQQKTELSLSQPSTKKEVGLMSKV